MDETTVEKQETPVAEDFQVQEVDDAPAALVQYEYY